MAALALAKNPMATAATPAATAAPTTRPTTRPTATPPLDELDTLTGGLLPVPQSLGGLVSVLVVVVVVVVASVVVMVLVLLVLEVVLPGTQTSLHGLTQVLALRRRQA